MLGRSKGIKQLDYIYCKAMFNGARKYSLWGLIKFSVYFLNLKFLSSFWSTNEFLCSYWNVK